MSYQHKYELKKLFELFCDCSGLMRDLRIIGLALSKVVSTTRVITVVM
jgi:hypothetical protein